VPIAGDAFGSTAVALATAGNETTISRVPAGSLVTVPTALLCSVLSALYEYRTSDSV
jgi:hypothetical protein